MAKAPTRMLGDYCQACLSGRHPGPFICDHDLTAPCPKCGLPFGGLTPLMDGSMCWRCAWAAGCRLDGRHRLRPGWLDDARGDSGDQ